MKEDEVAAVIGLCLRCDKLKGFGLDESVYNCLKR